MSAMSVLVFLADHPELLYVASSHGAGINSTSYRFSYEDGSRYHDANYYRTHHQSWNEELVMDAEEEEKPEWYYNELAPEIPKGLADHRWYQSGWLKQVRKKSKEDDKGNKDNHWAWYDHPARMTNLGRKVVNQYRAAYEEHAAKKLEKQKEIERLIVVKDDQGYNNRRKYGFLARVTRETKTRLYVERVFTEGEKKVRWSYTPTLHGSSGREYVERADVVAENVTVPEYNAMRKVETGQLEWLDGLKEQEDAELDVIRERYAARREQNQYAYEDEMREALEQVKGNG